MGIKKVDLNLVVQNLANAEKQLQELFLDAESTKFLIEVTTVLDVTKAAHKLAINLKGLEEISE